jgi:hypothetical protein
MLVSFNRNIMGVTGGTGTANNSGVTPVFIGFRIAVVGVEVYMIQLKVILVSNCQVIEVSVRIPLFFPNET